MCVIFYAIDGFAVLCYLKKVLQVIYSAEPQPLEVIIFIHLDANSKKSLSINASE